MTQVVPMAAKHRWIAATAAFLSGGAFPAFAVFALLFYQVFIAIMAFSPPATGVWGEFVEDFRLRCFTFSAEGGMLVSSAWVMLSEPLPLEAIFLFLWREPLRELWRSRRRALPLLAGLAMFLVASLAASLLFLGRAQARRADLPFPADRLRAALPMPAFTLANQDGESISPADFKGRVVLLTAVYATCTRTCPMILAKIRSVLDELTPEQRNELAVIAFSLSPETDTRELRRAITRIYDMKGQFHFVNGLPSEVNALLDRLNISRTRDEKTGQIIHSNLFLLLDREGRIAYRLSLSEHEQSWLAAALRHLLAEKPSQARTR